MGIEWAWRHLGERKSEKEIKQRLHKREIIEKHALQKHAQTREGEFDSRW
jgi:hypothetical protein